MCKTIQNNISYRRWNIHSVTSDNFFIMIHMCINMEAKAWECNRLCAGAFQLTEILTSQNISYKIWNNRGMAR